MSTQSIQQSLAEFCIRQGDTCLILGHRLSEWCGHAPMLEEDIAMTNIALDLIGQATLFLEYAAELEGKGRSGDDLAFHRDAMQFRNFMLVEQPNGDFAQTMLRQFFFDAYQFHLYSLLKGSADEKLASIAEKGIKETSYHLRHSGEWVVRMGDGTAESTARMKTALNNLWEFTGEMFETGPSDAFLVENKILSAGNNLSEEWNKTVKHIFDRAGMAIPEGVYMQTGSSKGRHTEHLGYLLAEMQFLPRAYPGAKW